MATATASAISTAEQPTNHAVDSDDHHDPVPLIHLELQNVTYSPRTQNNHVGGRNKTSSQMRTTVLHNVSTTIQPYQVAAWMGPSGSGKTSLLTVAAGLTAHSDPQALSKDTRILVNGELTPSIPKRLVGVVWQDDLLLSNLTVYENVWYAARLKTPQSVDDTVVQQLVRDTLQQLELERVQHSLVGNPLAVRGISGGERKRVAVASELVLRPSLLCLDEPTSGLDATTALGLMQTLQQLAHDQGHAICVVLHQPRTTIFNSYLDSLLLLSQGRVIYHGPPQQVRPYLEQLRQHPINHEDEEGNENDTVGIPVVTPLPPETGIADWIMDVVKEDEQKCRQRRQEQLLQDSKDNKEDQNVIQDVDSTPTNTTTMAEENAVWSLGDYWQHHLKQQEQQQEEKKSSFVMKEKEDSNDVPQDEPSQALTNSTNNGNKPLPRRMSTLQELSALPKFNTSFAMQFQLLTQRTLKQQRGERLTSMALVLQFTYLFFTALFWWRMPHNTDYIYQRNSLFFFMLIGQSNGVVTSAVHVFATERTLLQRERAKKMYRVASYFLAKTVSDMTNNVLLPVLYTMIVYWMANLRPTVTAYCQFSLTYYLIFSTAQSMGLALSIAIPKTQLALVLAPPITLFFMIMGGFYIPIDQMHPGIEWATWLSFCRYGYSALLINEYAGRDIPCANGGNQSPETDDLVSILAPRGSDTADNCPLAGEDVLKAMGIQGAAVENFWFNIVMLVLLQLIFRLISYWMLRRSK
eukprot:CAMPEP_0172445160 /NCGR_PEP_ID=MMETSP1065-20121228/5083_1 /TAXON_ID=265537 /ORGANISM="Amphiprora paludosa, Strain CCMP125" /LENGTH=748 /DNA_ID=CAMNT_0013195957 /DNA_START=16 /DNA_END=2262 /DNA_ORIENTATION=-